MKKILSGTLALLLLTESVFAQNDKTAQKQKIDRLNLSTEQKTKMQALRAQQQNERAEWKKDKSNTAATAHRKNELRKKHREEMKAVLTPAQQELITKIKAEQRKEGKSSRKHQKRMAKAALDLSGGQQTKIKWINEDFKIKRAVLRTNESLSAEIRKEQMKSLAQQRHEQVKQLLTAEQQQKLKNHYKEHRSKNCR